MGAAAPRPQQPFQQMMRYAIRLTVLMSACVDCRTMFFDPCKPEAAPEQPVFRFQRSVRSWQMCLIGDLPLPLVPDADDTLVEETVAESGDSGNSSTTAISSDVAASTGPSSSVKEALYWFSPRANIPDPPPPTTPPRTVPPTIVSLTPLNETVGTVLTKGNSRDYADICAFKYRCLPAMRGNRKCDEQCKNALCAWDSGDCADHQGLPIPSDICYYRHGCYLSLRGNGRCDQECQNPTCDFDNGDCGNVCTCTNGIAGTGDRCLVRGSETCVKCNQGYHLEMALCAVNVCTCEHGTPNMGLNCVEHDRNACAACDAGFHRVQDACHANECRCPHGLGASGIACPEHQGTKCVACDDLYSLHEFACTLSYHVYSNALCFDPRTAYMATVYNSTLKSVAECRMRCDDVATCQAFAVIPRYEKRKRTAKEKQEEEIRTGKIAYDTGELPHVNGCYLWHDSVHVQASPVSVMPGNFFKPLCAIKKTVVSLGFVIDIYVVPPNQVEELRLVEVGEAQVLEAIESIREHVLDITLSIRRPNGTQSRSTRIFPLNTSALEASIMNRTASNDVLAANSGRRTASTSTSEEADDDVWSIVYDVTIPNMYSLAFWHNLGGAKKVPNALEGKYRAKLIEYQAMSDLSIETSVRTIELTGKEEVYGTIPVIFLQPEAQCIISFNNEKHTCLSSMHYPSSYDKNAHCVAVFHDTRDMLVADTFYTEPSDLLKYDKIYAEVRRPMLRRTSAGDRVWWKTGDDTPANTEVAFVDPFANVGTLLLVIAVVCIVIPLSPLSVWFAFPYKMRLDKAIARLAEKQVNLNWYLIDTEIPLFLCFEDVDACLYGCCCPAVRAAHTYEKAGLSPFWTTFAWLTVCPLFRVLHFARKRLTLMALARNDPLVFSKKKLCTEALTLTICCCCAVIQEGRLVDQASELHVGCFMQFTHTSDEEDLLGEPIRVVNLKDLSVPRTNTKSMFHKRKSRSTLSDPKDSATSAKEQWSDAHAHSECPSSAASMMAHNLAPLHRRKRSFSRRKKKTSRRRATQIASIDEELHDQRASMSQTPEETLIKYFKSMDIDTSGYINYREFMVFLQKKYKVTVSNKAMQRILLDVDTNKNGVIDLEEFIHFFIELDALMKLGREHTGFKRKGRYMHFCFIVLVFVNSLIFIASVVVVAQTCSLVCGPDANGSIRGCPAESRSTCFAQCFKPRSLKESADIGMYASISAMLSGLLCAVVFASCIGGGAAYRLLCVKRIRKKEPDDDEDAPIEWPDDAAAENYDTKVDVCEDGHFEKAERYMAQAEREVAAHSYFNPLSVSTLQMGLRKPADVNAVELGLTDKDQVALKPVAMIAQDPADSFFVEKQPECMRSALQDQMTAWKERTTQFHQIDHAKELAEATAGPELKRALRNAYRANVGGLEEYELKLAKWTREHEEKPKEERKQRLNGILQRALEEDTIPALEQALTQVATEFGNDKALIAASRRYTWCEVRLQELRFGAKPALAITHIPP